MFVSGKTFIGYFIPLSVVLGVKLVLMRVGKLYNKEAEVKRSVATKQSKCIEDK